MYYYINKEGEQQGPFSLEELAEANITNETLVWKKGEKSWVKAYELEDLNEHFETIPPPVPKQKTEKELKEDKLEKQLKRISDKIGTFFTILCAIFLVTAGISVWNWRIDVVKYNYHKTAKTVCNCGKTVGFKGGEQMLINTLESAENLCVTLANSDFKRTREKYISIKRQVDNGNFYEETRSMIKILFMQNELAKEMEIQCPELIARKEL